MGIINFLRLEIKMKCLTKAFISMMALATLAESKLVVYGPQSLIDSFNEKNKVSSSDKGSEVKNKKPVINANYANFGHIPYGQSLIGTIYFDAENPDMCQKSKPEALKEMVEDASGDK